MQIAHMIHSLGTAVMVSVILGHIYIGTIGMEGAFDAMGNGEVDLNWAREHHAGWLRTRGHFDRHAGRAEQGADGGQPEPGVGTGRRLRRTDVAGGVEGGDRRAAGRGGEVRCG